MTPLRRVMNDAMQEWVAHLCNIDVRREREWTRGEGPAALALFEARLKERRADLATALRYLRKHVPNSRLLAYRID